MMVEITVGIGGHNMTIVPLYTRLEDHQKVVVAPLVERPTVLELQPVG